MQVRSMHIAYLINQYPAVSHTFIRREILELERQGHKVSRYSLRGSPTQLPDPTDRAEAGKTKTILAQSKLSLMIALFAEAPRRMGAILTCLAQIWSAGRRSPQGVLKHFIYLAEAIVLARWLREDPPSHIHAHFGTNSAFIACLASRLTGIPYSFTVHGPEEFDDPVGLDLRQKVHHAAFVVAISSFGRSQLMRWVALDEWAKIQVVRCGLDFSALPSPTPLPADGPLVFIGRFSEQKGVPLLIDAARLLKERRPDVPLEMVGGGELLEAVRAKVDEGGLEGDVSFLGYLSSDDVQKTLSRARALVVPSFAEGLPVVIMEAMAAGRPVISTAINGIPELVEDEVNGRLVVAGDVEALADAMGALLSASADTLDRMGKAGRAAVEASHNIETEMEKLASLIEQNQKGRLQ
ncbi:MAG: glycosyltransferase family 4 protein [Pseudomonadota bacterium]